MKKRCILVMLILFLCMIVGCGHKSKEEITDIEQFRCQDSIQTVFKVLGETDIGINTFIGECCEYDNLNLYGYQGKALFRLRDNNDTISSFECSFELNKKEFEDVLSQLSNKYGECEKHKYSNQIAYVWEFDEVKAEELGYNRISFSDYGDKKAVIDFSDEWSIYKDEAYYEYLEEKNKVDIVKQKVYEIGNDTFDFSLTEKADNEYSFILLFKIEDKVNVFSTQIFLNRACEKFSVKMFIR